jgi:hypothetical protein
MYTTKYIHYLVITAQVINMMEKTRQNCHALEAMRSESIHT